MKYCLIGEKLTHSYSAQIHGEMGLDYSLVQIERGKLRQFVACNDYDGFNVTIPYKKEIIPYLDELDDSARLTGAVNTVKRANGRLIGYNTDIGGMQYMIESRGVTLNGKNVLILGSGGTSGTAQALAKRMGANSVKVVSRNGQINYRNCYDEDAQIIINTSPVGMYPDVYAKPVELSAFKNLYAVFDCIYNPFNTMLLLDAKKLQLVCSDGLPMLVRQAVLAKNIWQNEQNNLALTKKLTCSIRRQKSNLVLFGMPSCGKTTLGRLLAQKLNRPFIDLDEYIKSNHGAPEDIIVARGEQFFRQLEREAVNKIALSSGSVISLGGGTVLDQGNVQKLKMNGVMVYVKRDTDLLTAAGRPLSMAIGVHALYEKRKDIYQKTKDAEAQNNGDINSAVKEIEKAYEAACNKWC